jgi:molybdopterin synthase sulfur carrier subunit
MPVLRLFAAAREAAGTASVEVPGVTVDEVLDAARTRFGPALAVVIDASKVWLNGEPASGDDPVTDRDEVAVLPPVSGGSGPDRPPGGRSRRPTFTPAEPPPPAKPPPAARRSPSAEAAAARRTEGADRAADRAAGRRRPAPTPDRPVRATPRRADPPGGDGAAPPGRPTGRAGRPGRAPGPAGGAGRSDGRSAGDAPPGRPAGSTGRAALPDGSTARRGRPTGRRGQGGPPPTGRGGRTGRTGQTPSSDGARARRPAPDAPVIRRFGGQGPPAAPGAPGTPGALAGPGGPPSAGPDLAKRRPVDPTGTRRPGATTPPPLAPGVLTRTAAPTGRPLAPPEGDDAGGRPARAGRLTRMRSVGVPVTGSITVRGRERKVSGRRERRSLVGRRYAVVYDTDGPKVTLGALWFVAVMGSVALGWWALTFVFAIAAGWAAMEAADRWRERGVAADPWVAALGAAAVAGAAAFGAGIVGAAILLVVLIAVARMALSPLGRAQTLSAAGNTVGCAIPFGLAAASVVLANDLEIGAVVALLLFAAAYDAGDYLIGSGSSNSVEGPLTGIVTIGVVAMALVVLGTPPFEGAPAYTFAVFAAVLCPLGQLAASAILPASDARAPTVRRLDTLILLAPLWVWSVGIFMGSR